jgi:hypothetical protein
VLCGRLTRLELVRVGMDAAGAAAFCAALTGGYAQKPVLQALQVLSLHNNSLADEGAATLAGFLCSPAAPPQLALLGEEGNGIGDKGFAAIAGAVESGLPKLRTLLLSRNNATKAGHDAVRAACAQRPDLDAYLDSE